MKNEGSGKVTGLKFENRTRAQLDLVLEVQSKAPYKYTCTERKFLELTRWCARACRKWKKIRLTLKKCQ